MKIKQFEYKKLFNLGNFEHEEIGITVEPEIVRGAFEDQDTVMSNTIDKVEKIHKAIQILQAIYNRIDIIYANWDDYYRTSMPYDSVTYLEDVIKKTEHRIKRCRELQKTKITKEQKQRYKEEVDDLKQETKKCEKKIEKLQKEGTELLEKYQMLKSEFKKGNLGLITK